MVRIVTVEPDHFVGLEVEQTEDAEDSDAVSR